MLFCRGPFLEKKNGEPHHSGFKFQIAVINVLCHVPSTAVICSVPTKCVHGMTSSSSSSSVWACKAVLSCLPAERTAGKDLGGMCKRPFTARRNPSIVVGRVLRDFNRLRLCLKCDGTRAETRFRLSAKRTTPFKTAGASVQSTTGNRGVRISGSDAGYTMFRGSV